MKKVPFRAPLEIISIEFLHFENYAGRFQTIFVTKYNFSCVAPVQPKFSKEAQITTETISSNLILSFYISYIFHSQRRKSESHLLRELSRLHDLKTLRTKRYHYKEMTSVGE